MLISVIFKINLKNKENKINLTFIIINFVKYNIEIMN